MFLVVANESVFVQELNNVVANIGKFLHRIEFCDHFAFFKVSYVHIRNKKKIREHAISGIKNVMSRELQECHKHELNIQAVGQGLNSRTGGMINLVVSFHSMLS